MAFQKANNVFQRTLLKLAGERYREFVFIYQAWGSIVGSLLAEKSHPTKYDKQVLFVAVSNNTWMQELILLKSNILARYRFEHKIDIKQIVFFIKS